MKSEKHLAKNVACPACERLFTSKAIALEHVENGFCLHAPRARKHSIYEWIHKFHPQLTNGDPPVPLPDPWAADNIVENGYKCPECDDVFKMSIGLKDHIESSVRKYELFCSRQILRVNTSCRWQAPLQVPDHHLRQKVLHCRRSVEALQHL